MDLAHRLNELAQANSDGLLSDDEYRLLRQSAFERYSQNILVPIETPVVPILNKSPKATRLSGDPPKASLHIKLSVTSLRRCTSGRNNAPACPASPASPDKPPPKTPEGGSRRGLFPRLFHRKPIDLPPLCIAPAEPCLLPLTPKSPSRSQITPLSPARSTCSTSKSFQKPAVALHSPVNTNLDDRSLVTSGDIRGAVVYLESELLGLVDAFSHLEQSAVRGIKKRTARRLPITTPTSVDVLLEGREWREHRIVPSPSTSMFNSRTRRYHVPLEPLNDGVSIHSDSSDRTSFSHSRSISYMTQQAPPSSFLSLHFPSPSSTLQRKTYVSSVSPRSTSAFFPNRLDAPASSCISHNSIHLPIYNVTQPLPVNDEYPDLEGLEDDAEQLSELQEIQQRRNEVITRYTQRIEYLKAKQKGAELHERLLRK